MIFDLWSEINLPILAEPQDAQGHRGDGAVDLRAAAEGRLARSYCERKRGPRRDEQSVDLDL